MYSVQILTPSLRIILILSSHLHLGLPNGSSPQIFELEYFNIFLIYFMYATMPHHLIILIRDLKFIKFSTKCSHLAICAVLDL
jgi:hypothetical protein